MEGELGSLEEVEATFAGASPAVSSLGSWAEECERAAAEAQMGRGCPEENLEGNLTLAGDLLREEDGAWLVALKAAIAPPPPRLEGARGLPPSLQGAPKPVQGPPSAKRTRGKQGQHQGQLATGCEGDSG